MNDIEKFIAYSDLKDWDFILKHLPKNELKDFNNLNLDDYSYGVLIIPIKNSKDVNFLSNLKENYFHQLGIIGLINEQKWIESAKDFVDDFIFEHEQAPLLPIKIEKMLFLKHRELESAHYIRQEHNRRKDQELARQIQKLILQETPPTWPDVDIDVCFMTSDIIGGDLWDFQMMSNGHLGIFLGDVSGHGIGAALIASMTKIIFKTFSREINNPKWFISRLNEVMVDILMPVEQFITAFYGIYQNDRFRYVNAGHTPALHYRPNDDHFTELYNTSCIIGYTSKIPMETEEIELKEGDLICLFTDGLIEANNKDQEMFGSKRLKAFIKKNYNEKNLSDKILEHLKDYSGDKKYIEDDITIITLRIKK